MLFNNNYGRTYIGILGQFANAKAELTPITGAKTNTDLDSKSIGLYSMWLGKGGYFADMVIRQYFMNSDVNTKDSLGNSLLEYKLKQNSTTLNLEMGREIVFFRNKNGMNDYSNTEIVNTSADKDTNDVRNLVSSAYFVTPRFSFNLNHVRGDSVDTPLGKITIDDTTSYTLSGGFLLGKRFDMNKIRGKKINNTLEDKIISQLYLKANYLYEFNADVKTNFAGIEQSIDNDGSRGEIGMGFDARFNNVFSLYIDLSYQFNSDYSDKGIVIGGRWAF